MRARAEVETETDERHRFAGDPFLDGLAPGNRESESCNLTIDRIGHFFPLVPEITMFTAHHGLVLLANVDFFPIAVCRLRTNALMTLFPDRKKRLYR